MKQQSYSWLDIKGFALIAVFSSLAFAGAEPPAQLDPPDAEPLEEPVATVLVPGRAGTITLPAAAFRPRKSGTSYVLNGPRLKNDSPSTQYFDAPLALPDGALLTKLVVYFTDNESSDLTANLFRVMLPGRTGSSLASVSSSENSTAPRSREAILSSIVDSKSFAYYVRLALPPGNIELNGVRVEFDLTAGYYVLDGFGGVHATGLVPVAYGTPYFGFDIARDIEFTDTGFYVLDGYGGVHAGGLGMGSAAPSFAPGTPYFGSDVARDLELR